MPGFLNLGDIRAHDFDVFVTSVVFASFAILCGFLAVALMFDDKVMTHVHKWVIGVFIANSLLGFWLQYRNCTLLSFPFFDLLLKK